MYFKYLLLTSSTIVGNIMESNAFLIPRWGGVIIKNPDRSTGAHNFSLEELKSIMSIFITQLRGLLGVHDVWTEAKHALVFIFSYINTFKIMKFVYMYLFIFQL